MNAIKYLDLLLENEKSQWAIVKQITKDTVGRYGEGKHPITVHKNMLPYVGKKILVKQSTTYIGLYYTDNDGLKWYFHPDWLIFYEEGDPISLFPRDKNEI